MPKYTESEIPENMMCNAHIMKANAAIIVKIPAKALAVHSTECTQVGTFDTDDFIHLMI